MLQLAARKGETKFSCYIRPTAPIHPKATKVHRLQNRDGILYHEGKEITATVPLVEVLRQFQVFLQSLHMPSYLVAHNVQFDKMFLIKSMNETSAVTFFSPPIVSVYDSLPFFKRCLSNRLLKKGWFKLETLAKYFLQHNERNEKHFHDATYDGDFATALF